MNLPDVGILRDALIDAADTRILTAESHWLGGPRRGDPYEKQPQDVQHNLAVAGVYLDAADQLGFTATPGDSVALLRTRIDALMGLR